MKKQLFGGFILLAVAAQSQTLTYANFSGIPNQTITCNLAQNSSFNTALLTTTGNGVTWNASGLLQAPSTPSINLGYHPVSSTPYASLFPMADMSRYDPALASVMNYEYYQFNTDSMTYVGEYEPSSGQHEIFQNPEKFLVFPFSYGQTFTDNYAKTNYSNATTISSYQTGIRTLNYNGYGTLILPQGSFPNTALITSSRTNSLGPTAYDYWWYDVSSGMMLMNYHTNAGTTTIGYFNGNLTTSVHNTPEQDMQVKVINNGQGNPSLQLCGNGNYTLTVWNVSGEELAGVNLKAGEEYILPESFEPGVYIVKLIHDKYSRTIHVVK
ncbi:MAG: T9SS type A sorting domain-containing protein [Bacteroidetes bacterium]|nr:T9SS type A sorting domain-containing protein [Bacteroidota bacterium]